jgi:hypothetical protein
MENFESGGVGINSSNNFGKDQFSFIKISQLLKYFENQSIAITPIVM